MLENKRNWLSPEPLALIDGRRIRLSSRGRLTLVTVFKAEPGRLNTASLGGSRRGLDLSGFRERLGGGRGRPLLWCAADGGGRDRAELCAGDLVLVFAATTASAKPVLDDILFAGLIGFVVAGVLRVGVDGATGLSGDRRAGVVGSEDAAFHEAFFVSGLSGGGANVAGLVVDLCVVSDCGGAGEVMPGAHDEGAELLEVENLEHGLGVGDADVFHDVLGNDLHEAGVDYRGSDEVGVRNAGSFLNIAIVVGGGFEAVEEEGCRFFLLGPDFDPVFLSIFKHGWCFPFLI